MIDNGKFIENPSLFDILNDFDDIQDERFQDIFVNNNIVEKLLNLLKNTDKIDSEIFLQINNFLSQFHYVLGERNDLEPLCFLFNCLVNSLSDETIFAVGHGLVSIQAEMKNVKKRNISCNDFEIQKFIEMVLKFIKSEDVDVQSLVHSLASFFIIFSELQDWKKEYPEFKIDLMEFLKESTNNMGDLYKETMTTDSSRTVSILVGILGRDSFEQMNQISKFCFSLLIQQNKNSGHQLVSVSINILVQLCHFFEDLMEPILSDLKLFDIIMQCTEVMFKY